jgi:hypothetical protein
MKQILRYSAFYVALFASALCLRADQPAPSTPAAPARSPAAPADGPRIKFDNDVFEAGKVPAGQPLSHTFIVTNVGNQTLEISKVNPTCGCTIANSWTHKIEPGQKGEIPITVNVNQAWSGTMMKTITIESNDKSKPGPASVSIKFTVWKPIDINQQYVFLNVPPENTNEVSTIVRIDNNTEQPIALYDVQSTQPGIAVEVKTNEVGKHYDLVVSAKPPYKQGGNVSGQITAKTTSTNMSTISIGATVNIMPIISVNPPQIFLESSPFTNSIQKPITIQYLGSGSLHLSNAVFSTKGVDVKMDETQPGRIFTVTLSFPPGFDHVGKPMELTLDSSAPQMPVIKVAVNQMPRQVRAPTFVPGRPTVGVSPSAILPAQARANAH